MSSWSVRLQKSKPRLCAACTMVSRPARPSEYVECMWRAPTHSTMRASFSAPMELHLILDYGRCTAIHAELDGTTLPWRWPPMVRVKGEHWTADFTIARALSEAYRSSGKDDIVYLCVGDPD